ncbi:DUF6923 family protein [Aquimarina agarilytica]|uniref:DUF6923 family protein n=1 Tax=Aquimarina agarilytica TaxID=1087449 RepID=UPI000287E768|nr:DUF4114 domain-containing protein [Aquimarina agarilytica]
MKKQALLFIVFLSFHAYSQQAFDCNDSKFYQVISGTLKSYDPILGAYSKALHTYSSYNAGGYNPKDNFLYAIKGKDKHLLRIGMDSIIDLGAVAAQGTVVFGGGYAADVDAEGNLWVYQNNTKNSFHKITNLASYNGGASPVFEVVNVNVASPSTCADITYINNAFYGGSRGKLYKWDLSTGSPIFSSKTVVNLPKSTFGAAYTDASNRLYLSDNNGGLYVVDAYDSDQPVATLLNLTEITNSNDGFKCANGISPIDKDQDGILDTMDQDTDGDGIPNSMESNGANPYGDDDGDDTYNYLDNDTSGSGDSVVQGAYDRDADGVPDFFDLDSDNDGIYDIVEAGYGYLDTNRDGVFNTKDMNYTDTDQDGLADIFDMDNGGELVLLDTDNDGVYNAYDTDSDNDGIVDLIEGQESTAYQPLSNKDEDQDGMDDVFDSSFGGVANGTVNSDTTDAFDYLDLDSNNDGISDSVTAYDSDGDGVAETIISGNDGDADGLDDSFDLMKSSFSPDNGGQTPASFPIPALCDRYNYLGEFSADGTPLYLDENDVISQATIDMVANALPESYPVPDFNPHYISSGYDTDVVVQEQADIWVTFISEGAGYKNTLGFYTYDSNNPITTIPNPEDITIIFPNVSAVDSGGSLVAGNKVNIGSFPPNTGIGWVLLANAWSEGCVGAGNWALFSNPNFNPESDPRLQYHNVLLSDPDNERIILGFEDIRRDYASCDQDFNDALFYITASPYSAMKNVNYATIESATNVTSANDGGLESNGDLAKLIAKRNFNRAKKNTFHNQKSTQSRFIAGMHSGKSLNSLNGYFPATGMYGTETTFISSPDDLIEITNAKEVFAIDYYQNESRVAAAFATVTTGSIYDHSKIICDRLNGSSLLDVRTLSIRNHRLINTKIKRANGEIEQTLSFSVKLGEVSNELYSFWNIDQYPTGDYLNFQIWGGSVGQVATIANTIIDKLKETKTLVSTPVADQIPTVFVQKGSYKGGKLKLKITNKNGVKEVTFKSNLRNTELSAEESKTEILNLSGAYEEEITVTTGYLFDIGFSISTEGSERSDALYLADGPWGIDYQLEEVKIAAFDINEQNDFETIENHLVERSVSLQGEVKGTVNMFRNVLPGDLSLDVDSTGGIQFNMEANTAVEVILVPRVLANWNNRLRYTITPTEAAKTYSIPFESFVDASGKSADLENIRSVVFSIQGDYTTFKEFDVAVTSLKIVNTMDTEMLVADVETKEPETTITLETLTTVPNFPASQKIRKLSNYPNPFINQTTIQLPNAVVANSIQVVDMHGKIVRTEALIANITKDFNFEAKNLSAGYYIYIITDIQGKVFKGSFVIR